METLAAAAGAVGTAAATAAPYVATVASVAGAGLAIYQGFAASEAAANERRQHEDEAKTAMLAADQEELARRKKLVAILSTNEALRAGRGLNLDTGTSRALREANIEEAEADISTARLNQLGKAGRAQMGALGASMRETAGLFSGASSFVSSIGRASESSLRYRSSEGG